MGRMGTSALRNIRALVARDLLDAVRNPTTLMSCAAGALIAAFFGRVVAGAPRLSAAEGDKSHSRPEGRNTLARRAQNRPPPPKAKK